MAVDWSEHPGIFGSVSQLPSAGIQSVVLEELEGEDVEKAYQPGISESMAGKV